MKCKKAQILTKNFLISSSHYYHKLINLPTRERKYSSTLLDNIYTNIPDCYNNCTSGVLTFFTQSDHYPIFTIRKNVMPPKPKTHVNKRNHNQTNIANFKRCKKSINTQMSHILNIVPIGTIKMHFFIIIITPIERSLRGHKFLYY